MTVDGDRHFILDSHGRVRFFHGTNAVQKAFPWFPQADMLSLERIQELQAMGFNALRLGVMWPGLEPERGVWNDTYLRQIGVLLGTFEWVLHCC